jgi:hypothetical protein
MYIKNNGREYLLGMELVLLLEALAEARAYLYKAFGSDSVPNYNTALHGFGDNIIQLN